MLTLARRPFCNKFYKMSSSVFPVWHFCEICVPHTTSACHTLSSQQSLSLLSPFSSLKPPPHFVYYFNYARDKATTATPTAICIKCVPPAASIVLVVRNQIKQKVETGLPSPPSAPALPFYRRLHHQEFPLGAPFPPVVLLLLYIFVIYLIIMQMLRRRLNLPPNAPQYFRFAYF